jgi:ATP-dependent DNA ligase
MLARLASELPVGSFSYEPKWDGFRCLAAVGDTGVELWSRHGRPLARYFPEVAAPLAASLPPGSLVDGELVIASTAGFDFGALLARVHPAPARVARLALDTPASFVAFDLVAAGGEDLATRPFVDRRARLETLLHGAPPPAILTPSTRDVAVARGWLDTPPGHGIDGVVAKPDGLRYEPGKRAMVKVKALRTVDCVVGGYRTILDAPAVASILLGLHAGPHLVHVGVVASLPDAQRVVLHEALSELAVPLAGHPWEHGFNLGRSPTGRLGGAAGRWDPRTMALDWTPIAPALVCEVSYDQLDGLRFRHPARLVRWRPDREAASCSVDQLRPAPPAPATQPGAERS